VKQHLFQVSTYYPASLCIVEEVTEESKANFSRLRKSPKRSETGLWVIRRLVVGRGGSASGVTVNLLIRDRGGTTQQNAEQSM
jgi:hypothetical protein